MRTMMPSQKGPTCPTLYREYIYPGTSDSRSAKLLPSPSPLSQLDETRLSSYLLFNLYSHDGPSPPRYAYNKGTADVQHL